MASTENSVLLSQNAMPTVQSTAPKSEMPEANSSAAPVSATSHPVVAPTTSTATATATVTATAIGTTKSSVNATAAATATTRPPQPPSSNKRVVTTLGAHDRPLKRRRRWCETVESRALANGVEVDEHRIAQRQKQIDYGKNTVAYDAFIARCPRGRRKYGEPMTPLARQKCSKRSFVGQINSWKRNVYSYVAERGLLDLSADNAFELKPNARKDAPIVAPFSTEGSEFAAEGPNAVPVAEVIKEGQSQLNETAAQGQTKTTEKTEAALTNDDAQASQPLPYVPPQTLSLLLPKTDCSEAITAASSIGTTSPDALVDGATADSLSGNKPDGEDMMEVDMFGDYSDMEDIELDDQGNPINMEREEGDQNKTGNDAIATNGRGNDDGPSAPSIFDKF